MESNNSPSKAIAVSGRQQPAAGPPKVLAWCAGYVDQCREAGKPAEAAEPPKTSVSLVSINPPQTTAQAQCCVVMCAPSRGYLVICETLTLCIPTNPPSARFNVLWPQEYHNVASCRQARFWSRSFQPSTRHSANPPVEDHVTS